MSAKGSKARLFASIRGLLLAVCAIGVGVAQAAETERTIIFFGDSLTAGFGLDNPAAESYPALIQEKITAAHLNWRVVNAGSSGETTSGGLRRVDWILRRPVDLFFLALGGNDGLRGIDPAISEKNLEQIIAHVRAKYPAAKIVVAGMEMPINMGGDYVQKFRAIFPAAAAKTQAELLRFLLEGVAGKPDLNQPDGIHPTAAGHRIVADNVWKTIRPLL
jgi:acyl-CoA thioesterase I